MYASRTIIFSMGTEMKIISWEQDFLYTKRDQDVCGRIILRCIFRKWEGVVGTGWSWFRIGTDGGRL
jgi:hypothetical protein